MSGKVIVTVKEGKVRGFKTKTSYSGVEYYTFLGVPYGQSTAGAARFKDPVRVKPWNNILDATVEKEGCLQFSIWKKELMGSEDCLYNNIYTPKIPSKGDVLKAVVVNIHPGGFIHGSPDPSYFGGADYVMHRDVVYVCVGYRLHQLGFLNLHLKDCSGNQAVKDVILSLQWIKENIAVFGGDPDNITIMGSSSGSGLVHGLLLSPLANGLYHKAILMGMYVFSPVAVILPEHDSRAYEIAAMLGYDGCSGDNKKLLRFYKKINGASLFTLKYENSARDTLQVYPLPSIIVTSEPGENSPLPVSLEKLIPSTNRVPILIGFCQREGCMAIGLIRKLKTSISKTFYKTIQQNSFGWGAALNEDELKLVQKEVEDFYLAGNPIESASQSVLCDIITDAALSDVYDSLINVISADLPSSVYVYNFHYDGKLSGMKARIAPLLETDLKGAFHGADYSYWSYTGILADKQISCIQPKDRQTIETFTNLLTTFAKTSNPNYEGLEVEWKPTTPEQPSHLIIDEKLQVKDELLNGERMEFWHKLKNKFTKKL